MDREELRRGLHLLRNVLNLIDRDGGREGPPEDAVSALDQAVNGVRSGVWALLIAEHSHDYDAYVAKTKMRRATEICEDVLADLYAETLSGGTPGLEIFCATLRELSRICATLEPRGVPAAHRNAR